MEIIIDKNYQNSRLDRFLREKFTIPQSLVARLLREKKIKLNKKKAEPSAMLAIGDAVQVYYFLEENPQEVYVNPQLVEQFRSWITFEDDDLIIINKPCGISSQGGVTSGISVDVLAKQYEIEARITHRLDRETSGIMIIAKNKYMARHVTQLFAQNLVRKKYYAMVEKITQPSGTIQTDLHKDTHLQKMVATAGTSCVTKFSSAGKNIVLVEPQTGKMHQIRVHLSHIGMPIIGDEKYGGTPSERMFLHAFSVEFDRHKFSAECNFAE